MATQIGLPLRVPPALLKGDAQQVDAEDPHRDTGVQSIHVAPLCGWGSDPHGPIYYKGRYHLFYQARPGTCQWFWGMRWEHVVSLDLVTWVRLPPALLPTPGGLDADGCFTGNIQIHPATGVPMLFYTGARLRHNPTIKHLPDPPLEACNPLMFHWETQLLAVCDPDDELMVKWRKVETPWMELPHCAYLSSWRDPFFVPPELDPRTGQPLHEIETSRPETAATGTKQLAKLSPHAAAPAGAEEDGGAAAAVDGAAATRSPASMSVENGSPNGSSCGSSDDDAAGDGGFSGRSSISNNASSTNAFPARSSPASTPRPPATASGQPDMANGHAPSAELAPSEESAGVLPDGMPVVRSADDVACSEAATQPCADGQGREHMMLIGSGLEGLGGTALIYRSADLASGWRFDGYLCTWPNLDTGLCWECPHLLNLSDLPPGVSCMAPTTNPSTTAANSSSTANGSAKAADTRVHVIASAAAAPAPAAAASAEDEQQLVELVNAAWATAGITPAQAVAWRDVSATAPAAPAAPEAAAAAAADAPPANPAAVDQPPLNSEPSATCTKDGTTVLPEPEEHLSLSVAPADAAAAAAAAATVAAVAADAAAAAAAAADAAAAPDTWTSALVQEVLEASLHQAETAAAAVQATLNSAVAAEVLDETSAMGSRSLPMTPAPSMAVSSVFGAAAAAAAAAAIAAVGNTPSGATPLASAGPSGVVPGPEMLNRSTSLRAVARALSRQASGASEDEVQTMLMQAMSDAMVARKHTAGALAAAVAAAAENSDTLPETADEPSTLVSAVGAPGTQSAPVREDLPPSGQPPAGGSSMLHHAATAPPAQTVDGLLQTIRADRQQQAAVAASGAPSDLNAVCNEAIKEESEEGSEGPEEESDGRELSFAPFAGMQRPIIPDPHAESEVPTLASEGPVSSAPVDLAPAQVPGATPSTRRAFSQPATLLPRSSGDYSLSPLPPTISIPPSTAASGELAPTPTARLAHANSLYDIKAVSEASVAGLGYASVLSSRAPHDAATAMMIADHLEAQGGAEGGQQRNMPTPPIFPSHGEGLTKEEIRAACRAYAEAAAAVQGHDLGCPANDAPVVQRCKKGAEGVPAPARPDQRWLLGLAPDAATYGILYFLGRYTHNRFHLDDAAGPFKLDMGNALYAPVAYYDRKHGRHIVWGYLKELRRLPPPPSMCNKFVASGCVSLPRALYLHEGRLHQVPLPELSRLRTGQVWQQQGVKLPAGLASGLTVPPEFAGDSLDLQLTVRRGTADSFAILLHTWRGDGEGEAALRFSWTNRKLEVVYGGLTANGKAPAQTDCHHNHEPLPPQVGGLHTVEGAGGDSTYLVYVDPMVPPVPELNPDVPDWIRMKPAEAGGELWLAEDEPLQLRVFIDASAVEVFTGTGQVLCTRVYRGSQAEAAEKTSGMQLVAVGGEALIDNVEVHTTRPAWLRPEDAPLPPPVSPHNLDLWKQQGLA